jgi:hypothetical protein
VSDIPAGDGKTANLFYSVPRSVRLASISSLSLFLPYVSYLLQDYFLPQLPRSAKLARFSLSYPFFLLCRGYRVFPSQVVGERRATGKWEGGRGKGEGGRGKGEVGRGIGEGGRGKGEEGRGNGERGTRNGERGRGKGYGEVGTGNGERGMGKGEGGRGEGEGGTSQVRRQQKIFLYIFPSRNTSPHRRLATTSGVDFLKIQMVKANSTVDILRDKLVALKRDFLSFLLLEQFSCIPLISYFLRIH